MKGSTMEADHGNNLALGHLRFPVFSLFVMSPA